MGVGFSGNVPSRMSQSFVYGSACTESRVDEEADYGEE